MYHSIIRGHMRTLALILASLAAVACSDGPTEKGKEPEPPATTGTLAVTIQGLPAGASGSVTLSGPNGFSRVLGQSETLTGLAPGVYTATQGEVTVEGLSYGTHQTLRYAEVAAGKTAPLTLEYRGFNLAVEGLYIVQSIQQRGGEIPLVAGRDGVLRVFAKANNVNTRQVPVRVHLYHDGAQTSTLTIPAPSFAAPMEINEALLGTSWNLRIPGALVRPGLAVAVEIDPEATVPEATRADNRYPATAAPRPLEVRSVPRFDIVFVPVRQPDGTQGRVTEANKERYLADLLKMFPIAEYQASVRAPYVGGTQLRPTAGWVELLSELEAVRLGDGGTGQYYYGVATIDYASGIYGIAYRPGKTALGNDYLDERNLNASMTVAHELGHSMNRPHSQCGSAGLPDVEYPHPNGQIGAFGLDLATMRLYSPDAKDLMGYCSDRWVGDYTYLKVLEHRTTLEGQLRSTQPPEASLVLWGRVGDAGLVLEPAFQAETRPSLPEQPGRYVVEGLDAAGERLFSLSFAGQPVQHVGGDQRVFAFALPLRSAPLERLATLRLRGPGGRMTERAAAPAPGQPHDADRWSQEAGGAGRTRLKWNSQAHPLMVLRDAATGQIVSLLRGGQAEVDLGNRRADVLLSDGVRTQIRAGSAQ